MSWSSLRSRLPFGIGTVTMSLSAVLVLTAGITLSGIGGNGGDGEYGFGTLRDYSREPAVAWTLDDTGLPDYGSGTDISVADVAGDDWLISYPSGIGKAFLLVDRDSGRPRWEQPVVAGLGDCAFTDGGRLGCAIRLGDIADGFYLVDLETGDPGRPGPLDASAQVLGVGGDFLRINQGGYQASLREPGGRLLWERSFGGAATAELRHDLLVVRLSDGGRHILDQRDGSDLLACHRCEIYVYPTGVVTQNNNFEERAITGYPAVGGSVEPEPSWQAASLKVEPGPAVLPVVTAADHTGEEMFRYEVRDPATAGALWTVSDPELSAANTRPCGSLVAFALKDRSRMFYRLADGTRLGGSPAPEPNTPNTTIDYLRCVGSVGDHTVLFANEQQITAFDTASGEIRWELPLFGKVTEVDGYLVAQQGSAISLLRPTR